MRRFTRKTWRPKEGTTAPRGATRAGRQGGGERRSEGGAMEGRGGGPHHISAKWRDGALVVVPMLPCMDSL